IAAYTFASLNSNGGASFSGSQSGDHFDYSFDGTTTAPGTARTVSATNGAAAGSGNATYSIASDTTAPSVTAPGVTAGYHTSLSLGNVSPGGSALKVGTRIYYRGSVGGGGSFKLTNAVTDGESGAGSSATAALGGTTSGWSHTPSTVSTPAGGPYDSNPFSWSQGTTSSPTEIVTAGDGAGNTSAASTLTLTNDSNPPTGGALTVNGGAAWSTTGNF